LLAVFLVAALLGFASDQLGKRWAFSLCRESAGACELIPGLIAGVQARNSGGMCSLEGTGTWLLRGFLFLVGFVTAGIMAWSAIVLDRDRWGIVDALAGGLLLGGVLGNQYDRLALGYVRDFLVLAARPHEVFNPGDVFMVLGGTLLLGSLFFGRRRRLTPIAR
jgi:signal peptidase II